MADRAGKVLGAVEAALRENPEATVDELFEVAKKVDSAVAQLTKRQFHARYPLQVKRKLAPPRPRKPRKPKPAARKSAGAKPAVAARDAVRSSFLRFASELAAAEARKDVVRVVAGVDRYVDEVLEATGRS